ncbi:MAG: ABC transporter ATP-binding protein [Deltaproteobacteria bacterium]|nr:ABC transporter ATP-binding protein [Deltaproteobacteria bacterium]
MIILKNLNKHYKSIQALKNVHLHINRGELFAYLGPNGAGKTTTIRIMTGLTKLSSGTVLLNRFDIEQDQVAAKKESGLVPQSINLDQELTVAENLDIHGMLYQMPVKARRSKTDELLDYMDITDRKKTLVKHLSGGLKRRVMIARALMHSPKILFLDEPTVGLDANIRRRIWAIVKKIQQDGTTIFLTTHYIEEAEFLAQRVAFLNNGEIVALDTPKNLMQKMGTWAIDRLEESNMETTYFQTREAAKKFMADQKQSFTLRHVNLEDAFLTLTGKKVK